MPRSTNGAYDVAIVGGGPAGLTAAVWLGRHMRQTLLVDSGDPRNWEARGVHGYLGLPDVSPAELRGRGRDEARRYGATLVDGCVATIERHGDTCRLTLEDGQAMDGRRVLLAFGIRDVWPEIPGLEHCYGETAHHCPNCDGYETRYCRVAVIASGKRAADMALALTTWTHDIFICTNGAPVSLSTVDLAKLERAGIPVIVERVERLIQTAGKLSALKLTGERELACQRLFFSIGNYPADDLGQKLGCKRDEDGFIIVDDGYRTSVPNVYAAGDIIPGPQLAVAAAADGAMAALSIHRSLNEGEAPESGL